MTATRDGQSLRMLVDQFRVFDDEDGDTVIAFFDLESDRQHLVEVDEVRSVADGFEVQGGGVGSVTLHLSDQLSDRDREIIKHIREEEV